jgi:hypothetical protein
MNLHDIYTYETGKKPHVGSLAMGDFIFTDDYIEWLENRYDKNCRETCTGELSYKYKHEK